HLLDMLDNAQQIAEILVIPWSLDEIQNWVQTWQAAEKTVALLASPSVPSPARLAQSAITVDPVLEEALKMLTENVNISTGIAHPMDRVKTIALFRKLNRARTAYDVAEIRSWLVRHRWRAEAADKVQEIAERVKQGKSFRGAQDYWADNIVQVLRERAANSAKG